MNTGTAFRYTAGAAEAMNVSDEQKTKFIETHPQTKAVFYGNHATSDGWRDHDRFQHYRWCLHAHTWIPFDQALPK